MATLQKIRSKGPLLLIVIGLALFAFIAGDAWKMFKPNQGVAMVGSINGKKISALEFQEAVERYTKIIEFVNYGVSLSEADQNSIQDEVWQTLVRKYVIEEEATKAGITVTDAEIMAIVEAGQNPILSQTPFVNQETGLFDANTLRSFLSTYSMLDASQLSAEELAYCESLYSFWEYIEETLRQNQYVSKYMNIVGNGVTTTNKFAVDDSYKARVRKNDVVVALLPFTSIDESNIQVTESELKAKYNKMKDVTFQVSESRDIRYIDVEIMPSQKDKDDLLAEVKQNADELSSVTSDYSAFVRMAQSEVSYVDLPFTTNRFPQDVVKRFDSVKVGNVYGPYFNAEDNTYNAFKLISKISAYDSIQYRMIQVIGDSNEDIAQRSDSIVKALKAGADFETLAAKYQQTGLSQWISSAMYESSSLNSQDVQLISQLISMNKKEIRPIEIGQVKLVAQVTAQKNKVNKYKAAVIKRTVDFSSETADKAYDDLSNFVATNNSLEALKANARLNGYSLVEVPDFYSSRHIVGGVEKTKDLLRWIFQAKEGEISKIYECGAENDHLMIAAVENVHKKGNRDIKYLRAALLGDIANQKKAEYAIENIFSKTTDYKSIDGIVVDTLHFVNFDNATYIQGLPSNEYLIGAAVAKTQRDQFSAPVKGNSGVFVAKKITSDDNSGGFDKSMEESRVKSTASSMIVNNLYIELVDRAKVEDNRYLYF
ncbi:MAG: SurA N-terminal domain-containing protein [Bacteroidaceae bacterium]|nr:SurA N-terminal domain-containing protein [Bacteroidaceae bacterium]